MFKFRPTQSRVLPLLYYLFKLQLSIERRISRPLQCNTAWIHDQGEKAKKKVLYHKRKKEESTAYHTFSQVRSNFFVFSTNCASFDHRAKLATVKCGCISYSRVWGDVQCALRIVRPASTTAMCTCNNI